MPPPRVVQSVADRTRCLPGGEPVPSDVNGARVDQCGADWILYESDFPHPTSMSPGPATAAVEPRQYIADTLGDLPEDVLRKILHDNAAKLYHMD